MRSKVISTFRPVVFVLLLCFSCEAFPTDPINLRVIVERNRKVRLVGQADYDDKQEEIQYTVKITNDDLHKSLDSARAKMWVFGESTTERGKLTVFSIDEKPLTLAAHQSMDFETTSVTNVFDNNFTAKFGAKCSGWVVLIYDATGKIINQKASSERYLKGVEALANLKVKDFCDRDYKPVKAFN